MEVETFSIQENVEIAQEDVTMQLRKTPNGRHQGWTEVRGFDSRGLLINPSIFQFPAG